MPITRGRDARGPFYRYGTHGSKYHYIARNVLSRNQAKRKAHIQGYAIQKSQERHGGALTDYLPSFIRNRLPSLREQAPPVVRNEIEKMKAMPITSVKICRVPLQGHIYTALNLITLGNIDRIRKALNYDNIYHLFMVLHFSNGQRLRVDKNQVVHISTGGEEGQVMAAGDPHCDLGEFFARGERVSGKSSYWVYTPHEFNCQRFVIDSCAGNNLLTPQIRSFVLQDASKLLPPGITRRFANALTGIAARADRVIHGEGYRRVRRRRIKN